MQYQERIDGFVSAIWEWYGVHKRTLPWRDMQLEDTDERAYRVLVSEVMLQQTQVSRVKIVFKDFLERFPFLQDLADASNTEVILAWRGMGYNARALHLRDAARTVVQEHGGVFPRSMEELLSIRGIGPYTAAAVRNFAFGLPTPCIDTNIRRILHRTFVGPENSDGTWQMNDRELLKIAEDVLHDAVASYSQQPIAHNTQPTAQWHAALMDYGSLVQTKNHPKWEICILTARELMKTTPRNWIAPVRGAATQRLSREPGRVVGGRHIPNRIFRGKIVEALRDAQKPMSAEELGTHVCIDWSPEHREWLQGLVDKLVQDALIARRNNAYVLA